MPNYQANIAQFNLQCSDLPDGKLYIAGFRGEESLSRPFEFRMTLFSEDAEIKSRDLLNRKATLLMKRGKQEASRVNGIITQFGQRGRTPDYVVYEAVLVPTLWRLGLNFGSRVFQKLNVEQLVAGVLENAGFGGQDYEFQLHTSYPVMEYCVQYRETDLQFISRRLEHYGIYYYFDHRGDNDVAVFTDNSGSLPVIPQENDVLYNPNRDPLSENETMNSISCRESVVTGKVRVREYNYETPEKNLQADARVDPDSPGLFYDYGDHFKDEQEGELIARVRSEEILCMGQVFSGESDCRLFHAGFRFRAGGCYREDWNQDYLLTHVVHHANQSGIYTILPRNDASTYVNDFEAIPAGREYRPPRTTPIPRIAGIMTAKLESSSGDEYAFIDDHGRYRMRVPFDEEDSGQAEASRPIRLAQPYSGAGYGLHLPNHAGTEMVWACVNGDVDRPLGLSTVPNPSNTSPSLAGNKQQNILRTAAGNEFVLDDKTGESQIHLKTTDAHTVLLDDKEDKIDVLTTKKHKVTMDDKNENITVQTTNGHLLIMDDKNTKITMQSKNGHLITINDTSGEEKITLSDKDKKNTFIIDITNKKLVIRTDEGSIDMHAPQGTIEIKATTLNIETTGDTTMKAANTTIETQVDYKLKATNITEEASMDYEEKGMNLKSEASMEHKTNGMNVTSEAGVNQQVKGTMVTVQSSGPNTIKGMPVMIN